MTTIKRPSLHFTAPQGWINDPNGTLWADGQYHLFYQHDPDDIVCCAQHWGHAVSADLLRWEHLPVALHPDELGMIWSGSAVCDRGNTSGLGAPDNGPMVALFTHHGPDGAERQSVAGSVDGGSTFAKYPGNPVLSEPGRRDFRDPWAFRLEEMGLWALAVASGDRVRFYHSEDLVHWRNVGEFGPVAALGDAVWECPSLFRLPLGDSSRWVFSLSTTNGGPGGGPGMFYFVGDFDGSRFMPEAGPLPVDHGRDFYAAIPFQDAPQPVWIGWQMCWHYSTATPAQGWRAMMSLPRSLSLVDDGDGPRLRQHPCEAFAALPRAAVLGVRGMALRRDRTLQYSSCGDLFEVLAELEPGEGALELELFGSLRLTLDAGNLRATVERLAGANDCQHPGFAEALSAPLRADVPLTLHLVADANTVEVFLQDGRAVLSALTYPLGTGRGVSLRALREPCSLRHFAINRIQNHS